MGRRIVMTALMLAFSLGVVTGHAQAQSINSAAVRIQPRQFETNYKVWADRSGASLSQWYYEVHYQYRSCSECSWGTDTYLGTAYINPKDYVSGLGWLCTQDYVFTRPLSTGQQVRFLVYQLFNGSNAPVKDCGTGSTLSECENCDDQVTAALGAGQFEDVYYYLDTNE